MSDPTPEQITAAIRNVLKTKLLSLRKQMFPGIGYLPYCDFCGGFINEKRPADLHEWLIKRNVVQSWPEDKRDSSSMN